MRIAHQVLSRFSIVYLCFEGMGFTIRTYTRRAEGQPAEAPTAADPSTGKSKWMIGTKKSISKDDASPFFGALEVRLVQFVR